MNYIDLLQIAFLSLILQSTRGSVQNLEGPCRKNRERHDKTMEAPRLISAKRESASPFWISHFSRDPKTVFPCADSFFFLRMNRHIASSAWICFRRAHLKKAG